MVVGILFHCIVEHASRNSVLRMIFLKNKLVHLKMLTNSSDCHVIEDITTNFGALGYFSFDQREGEGIGTTIFSRILMYMGLYTHTHTESLCVYIYIYIIHI